MVFLLPIQSWGSDDSSSKKPKKEKKTSIRNSIEFRIGVSRAAPGEWQHATPLQNEMPQPKSQLPYRSLDLIFQSQKFPVGKIGNTQSGIYYSLGAGIYRGTKTWDYRRGTVNLSRDVKYLAVGGGLNFKPISLPLQPFSTSLDANILYFEGNTKFKAETGEIQFDESQFDFMANISERYEINQNTSVNLTLSRLTGSKTIFTGFHAGASWTF